MQYNKSFANFTCSNFAEEYWPSGPGCSKVG